MPVINGETNVPVELILPELPTTAGADCSLEVDVEFSGPDGATHRVPAYWAGEGEFRVRYASPAPGRYRWRCACPHPAAASLDGCGGELVLSPYSGDNPLYRHGPLRVAAGNRHFEHLDGTPFFWLGDTWWMGLTRRLGWPDDFQALTADRAAKGFSVIQIVAGLYPDMPAFDERGANEAGFPWTQEFGGLNPAYFDQADLRIRWLVRCGLAPCIVACWGYFLPWMGIDKMKRHWRNLVARWGAYPVFWCLAGEGSMPYYLAENPERAEKLQKEGWSEIGRYLRQIDPWRRPVTIHPSASARETVEDESVLDFDMLQTGHGDRASLPNTVRRVTGAYARSPVMPVLNGEVNYEGIGEACRQEVQRLMVWTCLLSGACGHTYGANGIWQVNTRARPYGPSPHGMAWGNTPWEDACRLPGSAQAGLARRVLERYPWWRFTPHPEWVDPHWTAEAYNAPYAAGIPGEVRVIYLPEFPWGPVTLKGLEPGHAYRVSLVNPVTGEETAVGTATGDAGGDWPLQRRKRGNRLPFSFPLCQDWVVVLESTTRSFRPAAAGGMQP